MYRVPSKAVFLRRLSLRERKRERERERESEKRDEGGVEGRIGKRLHLGCFYTDILFLLSRLLRAEHVDFRVGYTAILTVGWDARSRKINVVTLHRTFARCRIYDD